MIKQIDLRATSDRNGEDPILKVIWLSNNLCIQLLLIMIEVAKTFPKKTFGLSVIKNLPQNLYENALKEPNIILFTFSSP